MIPRHPKQIATGCCWVGNDFAFRPLDVHVDSLTLSNLAGHLPPINLQMLLAAHVLIIIAVGLDRSVRTG